MNGHDDCLTTVCLPYRRRAFSLVEVLVVLGVIFAIIGLALPPLAGARERARAVQSMRHLGQIGIAFGAYVSDFGVYPFGEGGRYYSLNESGSLKSAMPIWDFATHWPLLTPAYTPWDAFWRVFFSPGSDPARNARYRGQAPVSHYHYANSFLARPSLWSGTARADERLIAPVAGGGVAFPSKKVMLWDHAMAFVLRPRPLDDWSGFLSNPTPMLFADAHAQERNPAHASEPVVNPLYEINVLGWMRLHNTRDGVEGLDF